MSTINDGGPAFPHGELGDCMSLRDWFAGQERLAELDDPQSVLSSDMTLALAGPRPSHGWSAKTPEEWIAMLEWEALWRARIKYIRADAMLKARGQ